MHTLPMARRLVDFALGALGWQLGGHAAADDTPEAAFLRAYADRLGPQDPQRWAQALERYLSHPEPEDQALSRLGETLSLSSIELLATALAAACERQLMVGRALSYLQHPVGGSRPTLGLLQGALSFIGRDAADPMDVLLGGPALATGLLILGSEEAPLSERWLRVPEHLTLALRELPASRPGCRIGAADDALPLAPSLIAEAEKQARGLSDGSGRALVVRTGSPREGRAIALAIAWALGRRPLFLTTDDVRGVVPWLHVDELLPVYERELAPSDRWRLPELPGYTGPVLALTGPDGGVEAPSGSAMGWRVPVPTVEERVELWSHSLGEANVAEELARCHRQGCGRIAELGRLARQRAAMEGRAAPTPSDVVQAAFSSNASGLDALAEPVTTRIPDEGFVLSPKLRGELDLLHQRCRQREDLTRGLGISASTRYRPGVRALLVGPSGTGKTLAAGWLAERLALPLYRVDLASVVSKYIGETEKNLAQLLARAEDAEVVLLFDEADSLFGKRTEVKQSNDRFANAQTNYLLQRIESFDGIAILTSNSRSRFDTAFTRRLDFVIEFPLPVPRERRALWLSHLGEGHELSAARINELSATVDLAGGHVRNVVLCAAVLANAEARRIGWADIQRGLEVEYRKLGKQVPAVLMREANASPPSVVQRRRPVAGRGDVGGGGRT